MVAFVAMVVTVKLKLIFDFLYVTKAVPAIVGSGAVEDVTPGNPLPCVITAGVNVAACHAGFAAFGPLR